MKFECGYCGEKYEKIEARTQCELVCAKTKAEVEKMAKDEKLKAEKQERIDEIKELIIKRNELDKEISKTTQKYCEDYVGIVGRYEGIPVIVDDIIKAFNKHINKSLYLGW